MRRARNHHLIQAVLLVLLSGAGGEVQAAKLIDVSVLDKDYLVVHITDGDVIHHEGARGGSHQVHPRARHRRRGPEPATGRSRPLRTPTTASADKHPQICYRKKKLSGHAQMEWIGSDFRYESTYEHWIYLRLPNSMQQGMTYTLGIDSATNSRHRLRVGDLRHLQQPLRGRSRESGRLCPGCDSQGRRSLLTGWATAEPATTPSFEGNTVYVYDVSTGVAHAGGARTLLDSERRVTSSVTTSRVPTSGTWISPSSPTPAPIGWWSRASAAARTSRSQTTSMPTRSKSRVRGYFYMRIGEHNPTGISPPPRTPLYIPGVSPASTTVYLTTMQPWHPDWDTFSSGDRWDRAQRLGGLPQARQPDQSGCLGRAFRRGRLGPPSRSRRRTSTTCCCPSS